MLPRSLLLSKENKRSCISRWKLMQIRSSSILFTTENPVMGEERRCVCCLVYAGETWKWLSLIIDLETCCHSESLGDTHLEDVQPKHKEFSRRKKPKASMFNPITLYQRLPSRNPQIPIQIPRKFMCYSRRAVILYSLCPCSFKAKHFPKCFPVISTMSPSLDHWTIIIFAH